jgi:hypothetical protein
MLKFLEKNDVFKDLFIIIIFFLWREIKNSFFGIFSLASSCLVLVLFIGLWWVSTLYQFYLILDQY